MKTKSYVYSLLFNVFLQSHTSVQSHSHSSNSLQFKILQVSCEDVITAYINRIQQVNPIINAVTSTQFSLAIDEAKQVDKFLNETTLTEDKIYQLKPLLGLPLTVKESCKVKGPHHELGRPQVTAIVFQASALLLDREPGWVSSLVTMVYVSES